MPKSKTRVIVHATDFSPASRAAFSKAVELAHGARAQLVLLHVRSPVASLVADAYVAPQEYEQIDRASFDAAKKQVTRLVEAARKRGVRAKGLIVEGVAHEQILRGARRAKANMIVLGSHGRTGLARFFLGSVAGRVASLAPCPVLTVRRHAPIGARPG
jgi:nucleotide-binding universal stress UspA family protein